MFPIRFTRHIKWILINGLFLLLLFFFYRLFLFYTFSSPTANFSAKMAWLGFRFDFRAIGVLLLPVYLVSGIFGLSPFDNRRAKRFWTIYLSVFYSLVGIFFVIDYQYFAYRNNRLDAEILSYIADAKISMEMVMQSYPVVQTLLILALFVFLVVKLVQSMISIAGNFTPVKYNPAKKIISTVFFFLMAILIYGKIGQFPLRWSDAFSLNDDFKSNMALNPFQSFFSSLKFRNEKPDTDAVKKYYPLLAQTLQLPRTDSLLLFERTIPATTTTQPNIVIVLCESFSTYKTSMCNNPLDPTPYFNALSKKGLFFSNCFSPAYGTARGVWATITGIPDVTMIKTATRIPRAVEQHTILNDFKDYEKYYFLGGSASWANIRGLLKNNITELKLYEGDDFASPKVDVWGISDRDLFKEANLVLQQQKKPFITVIQTANNHRPYTIPKKDALAMGIQKKPLDSLLAFGFNVENNAEKTNEEFNAMRYMDFCIHDFMENAKKQSWFVNTVFLFIGDHGIRGNGGSLIPDVFNKKGLTCQQVPMLIYSPALVQPNRFDFVCSQIDVLPTLAGIAGLQYRNTTLGRDLLKIAKDPAAPKFAFILDLDTKEYGILDNQNYYFKKLKGKGEGLMQYKNESTTPPPLIYYQNLANGFFETSRYMIYNNPKR